MSMHGRLYFILIGAFCLSTVTSFGQVSITDQPRTCATMEQDSISRARYPQRGTLDEFEKVIQRQLSLGSTGRTKAGILTIPIIVHVVHNGETIGTGTNLSQAQVQAQIEVLNEDFRRKTGTPGFNNSPVGADIEIEFCLSPYDVNGNLMTEPGIHRYNGNRADWSRDQIESQLKPTTIWNTNLFYNIWTVKFASSDANLLGYAQFPDQSGLAGLPANGPASTDGVVIRYTSFGSADKGNFPIMQAPYNKGRTLSHETGHWLGLRHIWGDGNCADDFVADTPPAASASSGCPVGRISCGGTNMVENYMDYTNDACMNIFTQGQKARMLAVMEVSPRRKTLAESNLCSPLVEAVPTANLTVDKLQCVLLGSQVTFTDLSTNFPTSWTWEFEGGDPNTSTERNPKVKYTIPGTFRVTLTATNSIGSSTPLVLEDYITVSEEGLCKRFSNFGSGSTSTLLPLSDFAGQTGYLTGTNSLGSKAFSEFFTNDCGYAYIGEVNIWFGGLNTSNEDATVTVTVWNARGPQGGPGSVIERKTVLLKQIAEDIANDRPTAITFDRETPVFSRPFHVGVELDYSQQYTLGVKSSKNGEATTSSSWIKDANDVWNPLTIAFGANVAMRIDPFIGMNPSVQIAASKLIINPGEEVILNGRGASIFVWNAADGTVVNYTGPQLVVRPMQTTTYVTTGSGLDLCATQTSTTIYTREGVTGIENNTLGSSVSLYPNPGTSNLTVQIENGLRGPATIQLTSVLGNKSIQEQTLQKSEDKLVSTLNTSALSAGVYLVKVRVGNKSVIRKWVKY